MRLADVAMHGVGKRDNNPNGDYRLNASPADILPSRSVLTAARDAGLAAASGHRALAPAGGANSSHVDYAELVDLVQRSKVGLRCATLIFL